MWKNIATDDSTAALLQCATCPTKTLLAWLLRLLLCIYTFSVWCLNSAFDQQQVISFQGEEKQTHTDSLSSRRAPQATALPGASWHLWTCSPTSFETLWKPNIRHCRETRNYSDFLSVPTSTMAGHISEYITLTYISNTAFLVALPERCERYLTTARAHVLHMKIAKQG